MNRSTDTTLSIRDASDADVALLAQMNKQLFDDANSPNLMTLSQLRQRMASWVAGSTWQVVLFMQGESVVGYAVFQVVRDEYNAETSFVNLRQFFIKREWRNQHFGTEAFHTWRDECIPQGSKIAVSILPHNTMATRFWSRLGFQMQSITLLRPSGECDGV